MANYAIMRIEKRKLGPVGRIGLKRILIKREVPTHFLSRPLLKKLSKTQKLKSGVFLWTRLIISKEDFDGFSEYKP